MIFGKSNNRAARRVDDIFGKSCYSWFAGKVYTLHLKTMTGRSSKEGDREVETCMETFAAKSEGG